jgi:hypothetical protein
MAGRAGYLCQVAGHSRDAATGRAERLDSFFRDRFRGKRGL